MAERDGARIEYLFFVSRIKAPRITVIDPATHGYIRNTELRPDSGVDIWPWSRTIHRCASVEEAVGCK